jgi:hypothetical protein
MCDAHEQRIKVFQSIESNTKTLRKLAIFS